MFIKVIELTFSGEGSIFSLTPRGFFTKTKTNVKTFFNYIKESLGEVRHIKWPTKEQTLLYTFAVVVIALVVAYYLGIFDLLFARIIQKLI